MQKKPPEPPKKPDAPKVQEGARKSDAGHGDSDADKSHRHRFSSDGEKTTIMPLSEILKARDAARGGTPAPPVVDQFPEFSYQPTVKVAIPAEYLKRKQAEAARDIAEKQGAGPAKAPEPQRMEGTATKKTPPPGGQSSQGSAGTTMSGEHVVKDATRGRVPPDTKPPPTPSLDAKAAPPELKSAETRVGPPDLKPLETKASEPKPPELRPVEKATPPELKPSEPKAPPIEAKAPESKPAAKPADEALPAIAAPMAPPTVPAAPDNTNQVIVFFSCKGGSGATALSTNVAHYCSAMKKRTLLVDMDLQLGDALAAMSLQPGMTIAKAMEESQRGGNMNTLPLPRHPTGVSVLSQVGSLDDLDKITSEGISRFVEGLRGNFDTIVVDGVRDFSDNVLAVLDMADKIAIVTVQEVLAIKRARWAFGILRKIGFDGRDITVVVNRYANDEMIPFHTLKQMFDPAPVVAVPADGPLVLQSLNRGTPLQELNPQHTVTRNISRLARNLLGEEIEEIVEATVVAKSFWDRLRPGKRE